MIRYLRKRLNPSNAYFVCCRIVTRYALSFLAALVFWLGTDGQVLAAKYDDEKTPEGWAWALIKQGERADFNVRCGTRTLDPRKESETRWTDRCRRLSAAFFVDVMTRAPWRQQVPFPGVVIIGARIVGNINIQNAKLDRALLLKQCRIEKPAACIFGNTCQQRGYAVRFGASAPASPAYYL